MGSSGMIIFESVCSFVNADVNLKIERYIRTPPRKECKVEVCPQRLTKPNVSGYIRLAPARGLLCEPCQEGPADQVIPAGTEATKMKILILSTA